MIVAEGLPSARAGWNGILIHAGDAEGRGEGGGLDSDQDL